MSDSVAPAPTLTGFVDTPTTLNRIVGWARSSDGAVAKVIAVRAGATVAHAVANRRRVDVGDCGFQLDLPPPYNAMHVDVGEIVLFAAVGRGRHRLAPVQPVFHDQAMAHARALLAGLDKPEGEAQAARLGLALRPEVALPKPPIRYAPGALRTSESWFRAVPGQISEDDVAVVGFNGQMYIYRGSNDFLGQYDLDAVEIAAMAEQWAARLAERRARAEAAGARLIHVLMPEKSSVLPADYPVPIDGPTPLYAAVAAAGAAVLGPSHIDALPLLRSAPPEETFTKLDSHLNASGSGRVFHAAADALAAEPLHIRNWEVEQVAGDLSGKFPGLKLTAAQLRPSAEEFDAAQRRVELVEERRGEGQHLNWTLHWRRREPTDPRRVLCFCNSFFSQGQMPEHLTWWFAQTFAETRFVWNHEVLWGDVDRFKPDILVTQSIERFLTRVPGA